jgi:hypothetical protein
MRFLELDLWMESVELRWSVELRGLAAHDDSRLILAPIFICCMT